MKKTKVAYIFATEPELEVSVNKELEMLQVNKKIEIKDIKTSCYATINTFFVQITYTQDEDEDSRIILNEMEEYKYVS